MALVDYLDHPKNQSLDLSVFGSDSVSELEDELVREFHRLCKQNDCVVFDLVLPHGMKGLPRWTSDLWLTTLQARKMSCPGVDMTEMLAGAGGTLELIDFSGSNFSGSAWHDLVFHPTIDLRDTNLSDSSFRQARLAKTDLRGAQLQRASFDLVDLHSAKLDDCDVANSTWKSTELISVQAGTMKNAESASFERCPILHAELPASLSSKLKSDDVLRPGDSLFIDASCEYKEVVEAMCKAHGLRYEEVRFHRWTRDACFRAVHPPQAVYIEPTAENGDNPTYSSLDWAHVDSFCRNPLSNLHGLALGPAPLVELKKSVPVRHQADIQDDRLKKMWPVEGRFLDGGNIFITSGGVAVIGHDEIRYARKQPDGPMDAELLRLITSLYPGVEPGKAVALWTAGVEETTRVRKILGARELVVIPQHCFHADLQVTYLGGNRFLVNSFSETLRLLKDNQEAFVAEFGEQAFGRAVCEAQSVIDDAQDQESIDDASAHVAYLTAHRDTMVRRFGQTQYANVFTWAKAAVDAGGEERQVDETIRRMEAAGLAGTKAVLTLLAGPIHMGDWKAGVYQLSSLLGNGLIIEDADGGRTYVTLGAVGMKTHKQHLCKVLVDQGVPKVEFMADEHWTGDVPPPEDFIDAFAGGLRCFTQKNLYPMLDHTPLAKDRGLDMQSFSFGSTPSSTASTTMASVTISSDRI